MCTFVAKSALRMRNQSLTQKWGWLSIFVASECDQMYSISFGWFHHKWSRVFALTYDGCFTRNGTPAQHSEDARRDDREAQDAHEKPISETYLWDAWLGVVHRGIFAAIVGSLAVGACAALWVLSSPWLAWRILCWRFPRVSKKQT